MAPSIDALIAELPKVELHVHLEGSMTPATLMALAEKNHLDDVLTAIDDPEQWYRFVDFAHFIDVYLQAVRVLRDEADFARMTADVAAKLAAQNVRYAEVHVSLYNHLERGIPAEVVFAGIEAGRRAAEREHGLELTWITDFAGHVGVDAGERTLDAVVRCGPPSIVAFGVGGIEVAREPFADLFRKARAAGLHSVPHAGETEGPDRVWAAIRDLRAERVGHGIRAMDDPALVQELAWRQIPLDVCPTSNLRTGAVSSEGEHPLPAMLAAGLLVTLNSDDPPMFGTDLVGEYAAAHRMGLDGPALAGLARNGVRASFLDAVEQEELIEQIDETLARWTGGR